jgi:alkylhydroperoxidase/carboxymuconolactone decarboxylase family protein YurZ
MSDTTLDRGAVVRREVLGAEYAERSTVPAADLMADFRRLGTQYAWGEIWSRPGLDRRMRSAITLTALAAGGHYEEFALHVRGAVNNGLTREEIKEVVLHLSVYCGFPTANNALAIVRRVLDEGSDD